MFKFMSSKKVDGKQDETIDEKRKRLHREAHEAMFKALFLEKPTEESAMMFESVKKHLGIAPEEHRDIVSRLDADAEYARLSEEFTNMSPLSWDTDNSTLVSLAIAAHIEKKAASSSASKTTTPATPTPAKAATAKPATATPPTTKTRGNAFPKPSESVKRSKVSAGAGFGSSTPKTSSPASNKATPNKPGSSGAAKERPASARTARQQGGAPSSARSSTFQGGAPSSARSSTFRPASGPEGKQEETDQKQPQWNDDVTPPTPPKKEPRERRVSTTNRPGSARPGVSSPKTAETPSPTGSANKAADAEKTDPAPRTPEPSDEMPTPEHHGPPPGQKLKPEHEPEIPAEELTEMMKDKVQEELAHVKNVKDIAMVLKALGFCPAGETPSADQVKKGYLKAALKFHPDRHRQETLKDQLYAEEMWKVIQVANAIYAKAGLGI
ncbi:hypothetical protein CYMTET_16492 [Cymbomonas tetramitiformis]|uniref:J domain-containing protein n=1 Tax=Cymbomonas tetramitiformis TaxID=36881 RepID=A0AAE0L7Y7_9CHLO|nr:hypothetical protein CYMTET_16492 [Cymbomonas tetramitiformis]